MSRTSASLIVLAALNGLCAVVAGAWAAHGFVVPLADGTLAETGSRFQMWHALALFGLGLLHDRQPSARAIVWLTAAAFVVGIAGFSGGLYAAAGGAPVSGLAPLGGTALMVGWLLLALIGALALFGRRPGGSVR